jgi:hypothetical protein
MPLPAFRAICRNPALIIGKPSCLGIAGWLELAVLRDQMRELGRTELRSKGQLCQLVCDSHFMAAAGCCCVRVDGRSPPELGTKKRKETGVGSLGSSDCAAAVERDILMIRKPGEKGLPRKRHYIPQHVDETFPSLLCKSFHATVSETEPCCHTCTTSTVHTVVEVVPPSLHTLAMHVPCHPSAPRPLTQNIVERVAGGVVRFCAARSIDVP